MKTLTGKNAVITGAASGIGFALAEACGAEGMGVAMVDLPGERLADAEKTLRARGFRVESYGVDVSKADAMRRMAAQVRTTFGDVNLLCNNAGIAGLHRWCWNFSDEDWTQMLDINLRGVVNGLQAFLPHMLTLDEAHIVSTSSLAGLIPTPMNATYCAAKFAVVGISEALALDLRQYGSKMGVSVLCPGLIRTAIASDRTPDNLRGLEPAERAYNESVAAGLANPETAMDPAEVARLVLAAVRERRFYILTHPETMPVIEGRMHAIGTGEQPSYPF